MAKPNAVSLSWSIAQVAHPFAVLVLLTLGYLITLLWADYVTTIISAMIFAQALYMPRKAVERTLTRKLPAPLAGTDQFDQAVTRLRRSMTDLWDFPLVSLAILLVGQLCKRMWRTVLILIAIGAVVGLVVKAVSLLAAKLDPIVSALRARVASTMAAVWARIEAVTVPPKVGRFMELLLAPSEDDARLRLPRRSACDLRAPPPSSAPTAARAARLLLTATLFLCVLNGALLAIYGARDIIDLLRDSAGATSCALDASGAIDVSTSVAREARARLPEALEWAGEKIGSEWRAVVCWPAIELLLLRSQNESVATVVDATVVTLRTCYPDEVHLLNLLDPPAAKEESCSWLLPSLSGKGSSQACAQGVIGRQSAHKRPNGGATAAPSVGALRFLLE